MTASATPAAAPSAQTVPHFGRFELLRLLGKSQGTMVWLVNDPRTQHQLVLSLPRVQPVDPGALEDWRSQFLYPECGCRAMRTPRHAALDACAQQRRSFTEKRNEVGLRYQLAL